jgi:hypothetical protein
MNYLKQYAEYLTIEEGYSKLEDARTLYDSLGGSVYKSAVYDDLIELQQNLVSKGGDGMTSYLIMSGQKWKKE